MAGPAFADADKIAALERELAFRRRCCPRWLAEGRMDKAAMAAQIAVMEAVLDDYRKRRLRHG